MGRREKGIKVPKSLAMFQVEISKQAQKSLVKLPQKLQERIARKIDTLIKNPFQGSKLEGKWTDYYCVRVWPYRIIYSIYKNKLIIQVVSIGHRREVYR